MATTNIMMASMGKSRKSTSTGTNQQGSGGDLGGGDLVKIQAHIRGRYQRRIMAKAKREAKELEKLEALGQLPSHRGSVMDEHDEYGNKKGLGHLMAEYAPNASSAKIHMLSPGKESEREISATKNLVKYGASTRDIVTNEEVYHEPNADESPRELDDEPEPLELAATPLDSSRTMTSKKNDARTKDIYNKAIQRSFDAKVKRSKSTVRKEVQSQVREFREILKADHCLLVPDSYIMQNWDKVTMSALFFTAIVTPFEVSFLETEAGSFLFWINQVVNLVFVADMVMQFFIPYKQSKAAGGHWVKGKRDITLHYLRTWFTIDIISILPFDELAMMGQGKEDAADSPFASLLKMVRIIRLLRLLKLFRVLKASRVYKRWEARVAIPYAYVALMKFSILLMMMGHWMACGWNLVAALQKSTMWTWRDEIAAKYQDFDPNASEREVTPHMYYAACLYWSITTITSVGYGDITPQNADEMMFCTFFLLVGSVLWAYIIGNACGIASSLDVDNIRHHQTMDALNYFMHDQLVPKEERVELRSFFNHSRELARNESYKGLIDRMSPQLKALVSKRRAAWLYKVSYFKNVSTKFIVNVTHELNASVFVPGEEIEWSNTLFSIGKGIASRKGRIFLEGGHWGDDFILETTGLKDMTPSRSLTYSEVVQLDREILFEILEDFPDELEMIRKRIMKMACARGILRAAKLIKELWFNPAVDIVAQSNGVLADSFHENSRDSFAWAPSAVRRAQSEPRRASQMMPMVSEDETANVVEDGDEASRRMSALPSVVAGPQGSLSNRIKRSDSVNSNPGLRKSVLQATAANERAKARATRKQGGGQSSAVLKKQMDRFHAEIGMMKETVAETKEGMENLEEKMDMILGLLIKDGQPGDGVGSSSPSSGPMRGKSKSSPALKQERDLNSEAANAPVPTSPLGGAGVLKKPSSKLQLAPLTKGATGAGGLLAPI
uniref:Ion transport domain-containing protein n=1 Tax=Florenciella parvula TaxID=236787 RepID=A0A7S2BDX6_9STRA|mmetsp:Transcript_15718/g.32794  ORF Transcript_15718/g.32794 Transcript_15718/m.32794 type:complete len:956 (+) Transcript_15718:444-3311(+)|eukprot:CAMPEP_0182530166 /NCGR_PEP_ID=MMETSP1323-20130603/5705_1 /TAXON_ID=236787 /ORGANISM="Florenciella parvula, Strain RCC1693" /LENGTH=955 /DNA_ID=CAMNT_0024739437 /DNA_START=434 /DNA_END=3301 /DNA_ORIENTATION=+